MGDIDYDSIIAGNCDLIASQEAEIARLRRHIQIHAGDVQSLHHDVELWRGKALEAEGTVELLEKNMKVIGKLMADAARERDALRQDVITLGAEIGRLTERLAKETRNADEMYGRMIGVVAP